MFNMASMAREECAESPEDLAYSAWLGKLIEILGSDVEVDPDGLAFDLYSDGCDPENAASELAATRPCFTLARSFLAGHILPFASPIENSESFIALSGSYNERNASVEAAVMELAHGSCHVLTMALAQALEVSEIMVITNCGIPVHSGLFEPDRQTLLDANGVHSIESAVDFWSGIVRAPCTATLMPIEDLLPFSSCEDLDFHSALKDFDVIAQFAYHEGLISAPLDVLL
ncbi:hypothetical protein YA0089_27365 [Pseudomonas viridiflava]|uniref:hypothetical protein n=1 Tax=Pseudomonas viridiflava TaxID=33069 RepID=UPI0018E5C01A|nr:hypothetical protein [Pseudomonas viridiflava]MBI6727339.1 hypothetical protein [Pseudomonas viridiflava]